MASRDLWVAAGWGAHTKVDVAPRLPLGIFQKLVAGDMPCWRWRPGASAGPVLGPRSTRQHRGARAPADPGPGRSRRPSSTFPATSRAAGLADRAGVLAFAVRSRTRVRPHPARPARARVAREQLRGSCWSGGTLEASRRPDAISEYASGIEPELFRRSPAGARGAARVSGCIDIGHVALWQTARRFAQLCPAKTRSRCGSPCKLEAACRPPARRRRGPQPCRAAPPRNSWRLAAKPLHFHLHDTHPSGAAAPSGISDHRSFSSRSSCRARCRRSSIRPSSDWPARPAAARRRESRREQQLSFTLEIHPADGRARWPSDSDLFRHWTDHGNAERMSHWLQTLERNAEAFRRRLRSAGLSGT